MSETFRSGDRVAAVVRSGFVEGVHNGSAVVLSADLSVETSIGVIDEPIFPRSANKPMQAVGMLRAGMSLRGADLALASASHRGETFHTDRVESILHRSGLSVDNLGCPSDLPSDPDARDALLASGGLGTPLTMNCSGKHAGMLTACVDAGWSTHDYLDSSHPLQKLINDTVEELAETTIAANGIDGCGAPLLSLTLRELARVFYRFVTAPEDSHERLVADAMRAHPELVSGTHGADTALMRGVPGLLAKGGAEGVMALALPGVGAVAVKIDDGAHRASVPVAVAALRSLDLSKIDIDSGLVDSVATTPLFGGGSQVGAVEAVWP